MIDWICPSNDILEAREIGRQDMQSEIDELHEELIKLEEEIENKLIIAYSEGYEEGHYDTVEGIFYGNCRSSTHDDIARKWLSDALEDGTFDRETG